MVHLYKQKFILRETILVVKLLLFQLSSYKIYSFYMIDSVSMKQKLLK